MHTDILEMLDDEGETSAGGVGFDLPEVCRDSSIRGENLQSLRESGAEKGAETAAIVCCPTCEGKGYIPDGDRSQPAADHLCAACEGVGWPGISPDDPLPRLPREARVPYLQIRYMHGRDLWTGEDRQAGMDLCEEGVN